MFCYRCKTCASEYTAERHGQVPTKCYSCGKSTIVRDYKAENVGFHIPMHMSARNTSSDGDFLPSAQELAGPGDPDGAKALEEWNENFTPAEGNKNPRRPARPAGSKKIFALSDTKKG